MYLRWEHVRRCPVRYAWLGLVVLLAGLATYLCALSGLVLFAYARPLSMMIALLGVIVMQCGLPAMRYLWLPWVYLFFAVPIPQRMYFALTNPLRRMAASVASLVLGVVPDLRVERVGSNLEYVYKGATGVIGIADACSGMRSTVTLCALGGGGRFHVGTSVVAEGGPRGGLCSHRDLLQFHSGDDNVLSARVRGSKVRDRTIPHDARVAGHRAGVWDFQRVGLGVEPVVRGRAGGRADAHVSGRSVPALTAGDGAMASSPPIEKVSSPPGTARSAVARAKGRTSARYWVCLGVLVLAAGGLRSAADWFGWKIRKEALPLKRPLAQFEARKLGPRYELNRGMMDQLEPMSEDLIESLGTREYVQLFLTDTQKAADDPTAVAMLFITYYTGMPDLVPHVPDECMAAAGYDQVSAMASAVRVPGCGAPNDEVPLRVLEFQGRRNTHAYGVGSDNVWVMYFFHANGGYTTTRNGVRASMMNPWQRYAYYAKIELTFSNGRSARAGRDASVAAAEPLLARVLPALLKDHFDLDKFAAEHKAVAGANE